MKAMSIVVALFAALMLTGRAATPGQAGGAVQWTKLTDYNESGQLGLLRFGKKTLGAWPRQRAGKYDLMASVIASDGKFTTTPIAMGWQGLGDVALVPTKNGGARAFFSGAKTGNPNDKLYGLNSATAPAGLASWTLDLASVVKGDLAYTRSPGATIAKDFTPLETWHSEGYQIVTHRGLNPADANHYFDKSLQCCVINPNIARDLKTNTITAGWCAGSERANGIFVQGVNPATGAAMGPKKLLAGSTVSSEGRQRRKCDAQHRLAVTARKGGGIYVAAGAGFPTASKVQVWRVGKQQPTTVANSSVDHSLVSLSSDADGHVWAVWAEATGGLSTIGVRRSDAQGNAFGPAIMFNGPPANANIYDVNVAAVPGGAWVFARALLFTGKNVVYFTKVTAP